MSGETAPGRADPRVRLAGRARTGQINALEPIIITIVLIIILGVGLLFYVQLAGREQEQQQTTQRSEEDVALLARISALAEIACSNDISATNCIDKEKADAFAEMLRSDARLRARYAPVLGATNITLSSLDLQTGTVSATPLSSNLNATNTKETVTYFTMHDPASGQTRFAWMTVRRAR